MLQPTIISLFPQTSNITALQSQLKESYFFAINKKSEIHHNDDIVENGVGSFAAAGGRVFREVGTTV